MHTQPCLWKKIVQCRWTVHLLRESVKLGCVRLCEAGLKDSGWCRSLCAITVSLKCAGTWAECNTLKMEGAVRAQLSNVTCLTRGC